MKIKIVKSAEDMAQQLLEHPEKVEIVRDAARKGDSLAQKVMAKFRTLERVANQKDLDLVADARSRLRQDNGGTMKKEVKTNGGEGPSWITRIWNFVAIVASIMAAILLGYWTIDQGWWPSMLVSVPVLLFAITFARSQEGSALAKIWLGLSVVAGISVLADLIGITFQYGMTQGLFTALVILIIGSFVIAGRKPKGSKKKI